MVTDITLWCVEDTAIRAGRQTQLRRPLKTQPPRAFCKGDVAAITDGHRWAISRYEPGNSKVWPADPKPGFRHPLGGPGDYLRDGTLILRIEASWIERLRTISRADIFAEGIRPVEYDPENGAGSGEHVVCGYSLRPDENSRQLAPSPDIAYEQMWDGRYYTGAFADNPWVAACRFTLLGDMDEEAHQALGIKPRRRD